MFKRRRQGTVIAKGSKLTGDFSADGPVEINGVIEGDLRCANLQVSKSGQINGKIVADDVIVDGVVEGPISCAHIHLQSKARVTGDIHYATLTIDQGGFFSGRAVQKEKGKGKKEKPVLPSTAKEAPIELGKKPDPNGSPDTKVSWKHKQQSLS